MGRRFYLLAFVLAALYFFMSPLQAQLGVALTYIEPSIEIAQPAIRAQMREFARAQRTRFTIDGVEVGEIETADETGEPSPPIESEPATADEGEPEVTEEVPAARAKPEVVNTSLDLHQAGFCTYSAEDVDAILHEYGSPAEGIGAASVDYCLTYGIDNAYVLWMFILESTAGTNKAWAGNKGNGHYTANTGNIVCAGYHSCYGRFRDYEDDWSLGLQQHFQLLYCYSEASEGQELCETLWRGKKHKTITEALNTWAPPHENDTASYAAFVAERTLEARRRSFVVDGNEGPLEVRSPEGRLLTYTSPPLELVGCLGVNVSSAINSSPQLRRDEISPGEVWSFNESWQVDHTTLVDCGVYGGGVCNLAARYSNVGRNLGLKVENVYHGYIYDPLVPQEDNLAIWSSGRRGGQDLYITNTSEETVVVESVLQGNVLRIRGFYKR